MSLKFEIRWWANKIARAIASGIFSLFNFLTHTTCKVRGCKKKVYRWRNMCTIHKSRV